MFPAPSGAPPKRGTGRAAGPTPTGKTLESRSRPKITNKVIRLNAAQGSTSAVMIQGGGCLGAITPLFTTRLGTKVTCVNAAGITIEVDIAKARAQCSGYVGAVRHSSPPTAFLSRVEGK